MVLDVCGCRNTQAVIFVQLNCLSEVAYKIVLVEFETFLDQYVTLLSGACEKSLSVGQ